MNFSEFVHGIKCNLEILKDVRHFVNYLELNKYCSNQLSFFFSEIRKK